MTTKNDVTTEDRPRVEPLAQDFLDGIRETYATPKTSGATLRVCGLVNRLLDEIARLRAAQPIKFDVATLTSAQLDGIACVVCRNTEAPMRPVGMRDGVQLFACTSHGDQQPAPYVPRRGDAIDAWLTGWIKVLPGTGEANAVRAMRMDYLIHADAETPLDDAARGDQPAAVEISPRVAAHVLWHFGAGGYEPGSFTRDLIALIARADPVNRLQLAQGHPAYVIAVQAAQCPGGIDRLTALARLETSPTTADTLAGVTPHNAQGCACSEFGPCPAHGTGGEG